MRIHTDSRAAEAARSIGAEAYASGQDIYFATDRYQPGTSEGTKLLAHELTHTIQQGTAGGAPDDVQTSLRISEPGDSDEVEAETAAEAVSVGQPVSIGSSASSGRSVARLAAPAALAPGAQFPTSAPETLDEIVDKVLNSLSGITTSSDSHMILSRFRGRDAATVQAILGGLKARSTQYGHSTAEMIDWLFGDMTSGDALELRRLLAALGLLDDLAVVTANQIKGLGARVGNVFGLATGSDNQAIYSVFAILGGPRLDAFLGKIRVALGVEPAAFAAALFGKFNPETADQLRELFLKQGGPAAQKLATDRTVAKIVALLRPDASAGDGAAVAWQFRKTPDELRKLVFDQVDEEVRKARSKSAEDALMEALDPPDYEEVRQMAGIALKPYEDRRSPDRKSALGSNWLLTIGKWIGCGLLGVITGLLSAAWGLLEGIWSIAVAAKHFLFWIAYVLTDRAVGEDDYKAITDFFEGLKGLTEPAKAWHSYTKKIETQYRSIDGSLADCKRIEFVVRNVIDGLVNVVLIFVAGIGLAKAAVTGARLLVEFGLLIGRVGVLRALVETVVKVSEAAMEFAATTILEAGELANSLLHPIETLIKIGRRLNLLIRAASEEGVWKSLKGIVGDLTTAQRESWQKESNKWKELFKGPAERHAELANKAGTVAEKLSKEIPEKPADPKAIKSIEDGSARLEGEVNDVEKEFITQDQAGATTAAGPTAGPTEGAEPDLHVSQRATGEEHKYQFFQDGRIRRCSDECLLWVESAHTRAKKLPAAFASEATPIVEGTESLADEFRVLVAGENQAGKDAALKASQNGQDAVAASNEAKTAKVAENAKRKAQIKIEIERLEQQMGDLEAKVAQSQPQIKTKQLEDNYGKILDQHFDLKLKVEKLKLDLADPSKATEAAKGITALEDEVIDLAIEKLEGTRNIKPNRIKALRDHIRAHPEELANALEMEAEAHPGVPAGEHPEGNPPATPENRRGGSRPTELGSEGKDLSRRAARDVFQEEWITDEPEFRVRMANGREVTFRADIGTIGSGSQPRLVESKFGPGAGLTDPQAVGYPLVSTQGAIPANAAGEAFARRAFPGWQPGQQTPPIRVRIDYWRVRQGVRERRSIWLPNPP